MKTYVISFTHRYDTETLATHVVIDAENVKDAIEMLKQKSWVEKHTVSITSIYAE